MHDVDIGHAVAQACEVSGFRGKIVCGGIVAIAEGVFNGIVVSAIDSATTHDPPPDEPWTVLRTFNFPKAVMMTIERV